MSLTKRYLEDVVEELGVEDIMDPAVLAEAQRRLDDPQLQRKSSPKLPSEDEDYDFDDEDGFVTLQECIASGRHLTDCDEDGYCNFCGEQDQWDTLVAHQDSRDASGPEFMMKYISRICEITKGCRPDMHEPDEQGLSVEYVEGYGLDNACMGPPESEPTRTTDAGFWLIKDKGEPTEQREWFNLACLIAVVRAL